MSLLTETSLGVHPMNSNKLILLTGATGYVGGRLMPLLEQRGCLVRCLTRHPASLQGHVGANTEVVPGDVLDPATLTEAFRGVDTAFYFVHSMGAERDFETVDRLAAQNFAQAAARAGVRLIVYLGGLGNPDHRLSKHLRSRQETGDVLRAQHPHVVEFRASIVIGSGSLSFEMIRSLVERLPVMICPRWVQVKAQPIAIEDLLEYLLASVELPDGPSQVFEIGGPDQVSYGQIMQEYARQRGLRRCMLPVPLLTPYLSSLWLGLVTPLYARIGRKLVESLRNPTLISNNLAATTFRVRPRSLQEAIARALVNEDRDFAATRWSDALSSAGTTKSWAGVRFGRRLIDSRVAWSPLPPARAFAPIRQIGGERGWYFADGLWKLRGLLDLIVGGVGLRRGRRDADSIRVGDTIDCWRVEAFEPDHRLRLLAEMRLPGRAWLEFEVQPKGAGSEVRQTAIYDPVGLAGLAYWYLVYPLHQIVFAGMLRGIIRCGPYEQEAHDADWRPSVARQVGWLCGLVMLCLSAAAAGGVLTAVSVGDWYRSLAKPPWTPPDWLFGPVWTALYLCMAISAWLVWRKAGWRRARAALGLFAVQLALNAAWSGIFFGMRRPGLAFVEILALWMSIAVTGVAFWSRSTWAALLLTPYLAWTSFAALLNFAIWKMN